MNLKKNIRNKFNNPDVIAVVSPYPKKGEVYSAGTTGVASYSKNVVREFSRKALIITNYEQTPEVYEEGNTLVVRSYRKNSPLMWLEIVKTLQQFNRVKTVMIHFDFSMYGSFVTSGSIVAFLTFLKL